jgi:hypothetical protein
VVLAVAVDKETAVAEEKITAAVTVSAVIAYAQNVVKKYRISRV